MLRHPPERRDDKPNEAFGRSGAGVVLPAMGPVGQGGVSEPSQRRVLARRAHPTELHRACRATTFRRRRAAFRRLCSCGIFFTTTAFPLGCVGAANPGRVRPLPFTPTD